MLNELKLLTSSETRKNSDLDELSRKNRELFERSKNRKQDFKIVESEVIRTEPDLPPAAPLKEHENSRISTADRSGYTTDVSSATWQYNNSSFSPRSVVSINGGQQEGLLKIRTSQSVANINTSEVDTKPWPHMPANLRPVPDSPQSTMTREMNENYVHRVERYNSMPVLETNESMGRRGTLIKLQDEKPRSIIKVRESESHEIVSSRPRVAETVHRVEERKRTEEVERRVLRRERRHKSHRSRYSHAHQEAIGWQGNGGTAHRSSSTTRGGNGYDTGYYSSGGQHYPTYNGNYHNGYNAGYNDGRGYYNHYNSHYNNHNGYDFPPAYPRRTASATLYH